MSRAFVKEDVDPPERSGLVRSASGLPPRAINYITARGERLLRAELEELRRTESDPARIADLETLLASVTVVEPTTNSGVGFGATVSVEESKGRTETYTIVGVDELGFYPDAVSWISPLGKTLLAAEVGHKVNLDQGRTGTIVKVEYRSD